MVITETATQVAALTINPIEWDSKITAEHLRDMIIGNLERIVERRVRVEMMVSEIER